MIFQFVTRCSLCDKEVKRWHSYDPDSVTQSEIESTNDIITIAQSSDKCICDHRRTVIMAINGVDRNSFELDPVERKVHAK